MLKFMGMLAPQALSMPIKVRGYADVTFAVTAYVVQHPRRNEHAVASFDGSIPPPRLLELGEVV